MDVPTIRIDELRKLCRIGWKLSVFRHGSEFVSTGTARTMHAEILFAKVVQNGDSIVRLFAASDNSRGSLPVDVSSIASLSRNLIEAHNVFQHVCVDKVGTTELYFRLHLISLHQAMDTRLLLDRLGFDQNDRMYHFVRQIEIAALSQLEENAFYHGLDDKTKHKLLKARKPYHWELVGAIHNRPVAQQLESAIYRFLSASVHSFPLGFAKWLVQAPKTTAVDTRNHFDALGLLFISMEVAVVYLASAINCYVRLRHKHARLVSPKEKAFLKTVVQSNLVEEWIEYRKQYDIQHRVWLLEDD